MQALRAIPLDAAREQALLILRNPASYVAVPSTTEWTASVHPTAIVLFHAHEEFRSVRGEVHLARALVQPVEALPAWDRVGTDIEHLEIVVHRETGEAREFDGDLEAMKREPSYPSVFHLLLQVEKDIGDA